MGLNGFVWWIGVVENIYDDLGVGRCQVRIQGWHTDNKSILPSEDLPWAVPVLPVNSSNYFSSVLEGDWVMGFFLDGENGQFPYMWGVIPFVNG